MKSIRFRSSVNPSPFAHLIVDDIAIAIFYSAATKRVDDDIASAFNHAVEGGVFDGGIVVDEQFQTSWGPEVTAGGPTTVYRRCLFAEERLQRKYNSKEVGAKMVGVFLTRMFGSGRSSRDEDRGRRGRGRSRGLDEGEGEGEEIRLRVRRIRWCTL